MDDLSSSCLARVLVFDNPRPSFISQWMIRVGNGAGSSFLHRHYASGFPHCGRGPSASLSLQHSFPSLRLPAVHHASTYSESAVIHYSECSDQHTSAMPSWSPHFDLNTSSSLRKHTTPSSPLQTTTPYTSVHVLGAPSWQIRGHLQTTYERRRIAQSRYFISLLGQHA